jgi:hypothetical protein
VAGSSPSRSSGPATTPSWARPASWQVLRVTFETDARNERSRTPIARLGARFEGIRWAHTTAGDGTIRDSAYYSIVAAEWPAVRGELLHRLEDTVTKRG